MNLKALWRARLALKYIFFEMLPSFLMGAVVFIFILLMFQAIRLTEFVLAHGVNFTTILQIMTYLTVGFLPIILPMSLLFSVLLTYGRLSNDSEIVSLKSIGISDKTLYSPAILLAALTCIVSAQTAFYLAPWGNRQFEVLVSRMSQIKASATIRAGVFSEGFFDLVVYANEVDAKTGILKKVFIYDERNSSAPLTIIAQEGEIIENQKANLNMKARSSILRLRDGNIHKTQDETYTRIDFLSYDINLFDPIQFYEKQKAVQSLTLPELNKKIAEKTEKKEDQLRLEAEYHRRWAIAFACMVFALVGVSLGMVSNKRSARSSGLVLSIGIIIAYWLMYVTFEGFARSGTLPPAVAIWSPNAVFLLFAYFSQKRAVN